MYLYEYAHFRVDFQSDDELYWFVYSYVCDVYLLLKLFQFIINLLIINYWFLLFPG